ncbi:MAG: sporulation protein YunB, partial [Clostridia bacterium]|nr:sporulation protein YunB [Clostridia bacterium]
SLAIDKSLQQISESKLEIPLTELWGSYWLANRGPILKIKLKTIGAVNIQLQDEFESMGLNQSRHKIYALFKVTLQVAFPGASAKKEVTAAVPIAESIIMGEVPENYGVIPWGNPTESKGQETK